MKKYKDYVFEAISYPEFNDDFEDICDKLDEFWSNLDISFDALEDYNQKDPQKVINSNTQKKTTSTPPEKMKNGALIQYNYLTNSGNTIVVTIDTPDNGTNTSTAIVKPIKGTKKIPFPAKWNRLTQLMLVPTNIT
jgi:hypothetical protein